MDFQEKVYVENPREKANYFSKTFYLWLIPILKKGNKQILKLNDLYDVLKEDRAYNLGSQLEKEWEKQYVRGKEKGQKPSLFWALFAMEGKYYCFSSFFLIVNECTLKIAQPLFLKWFVQSFSASNNVSETNQYLYAGGLCLTTLGNILITHATLFVGFHTAMKCRIGISSLIYRKSIRLSTAAQTESHVGQAVNMLSNDMTRYDFALLFIPYIIAGPIQLIIFTYLLWEELGVSSLAGIGYITILLPLQYLVGKYSTIFRMRIAKKTDTRAGFMNEIIIAIRVIKMYAWEKPFSNLINGLRKLEAKSLRQRAYLQALYLALFHMSAKLVVLLTVVAYIFISGNSLQADKIFFTVSVFNTLLHTILFALPMGAAGMGAVIVSLTRLKSYMLLDEQKYNNRIEVIPVSSTTDMNGIISANPSVQLKSVSASWTSDKLTLSNLEVNFEGNKLVMVVGSVGSGKSSFLNMLIAELPISIGKCLIKGKTSYAGQEPWIFSGNIKQNIIFGREFNEERYKEVISVCALEEDMKQWPYRDMTIVGERGISLSGGQKARVNLARALYQQADIYLLDDPLSAVDTRVSRHIFEKCVKHHLKDKLRILVTHQLQYLPSADHIVVLENGKILAQGTYEQLEEQQINFLNLVSVDGNEMQRKGSTRSLTNNIPKPSEDKFDDEDKPEAELEKMTVGGVSMKTYWAYFKSSGSMCSTFFIGIGFLVTQVLLNGCEYWLSYWTNKAEESSYDFDQDTYLWIYTSLVITTVSIILVLTLGFFGYSMTIAVNMHDRMFKNLVRAPTIFFDQNPSGRIMNRFTKDLASLDEILPETIYDSVQIILQAIGIIVIVCFSNYYILLPTLFVLIAFHFARKFYIGSARSVKRLEALTRSPIFTHLTASFQGLATIRSSNSQSILIQQFELFQDSNSSPWFLFISSGRWLAIWLEMISIVYLIIIAFGFIIISSSTGSGNIGLALSSVMLLNVNLQWGVRQSAETENIMISVERMLEYSKVTPEAPLESEPAKKPPKSWPSAGEIKFSLVSLSYGEKDVLKNLTFDIRKNEKIGIVGRTGAGKSSIITALFRLTEPRGDIFIDGIRINDIGLHDVRQNISIIPQEPVLFSGTMRYNLDPFSQFKDDELWVVLHEVELKNAVPALDFIVADGGGNFSVGQRQLVCLARAILRKNRIIVMDEATANVDPRTDEFIQKTIRQKFSNCSIITIAHRLQSVMDCDRILVLDDGYMKEYDHPHKLLQNPDGHLTSMLKQVGQAGRLKMQQIAEETYQGRKQSFQTETFENLTKEMKSGSNRDT